MSSSHLSTPKKSETLSSWDLVFPNDANPYGSMFGGRLMALMDKVGALAGAGYAGRIVTTASTEAMDFLHPIRVGDQIEIRARVVRVGRTSMVIKVEVYSDNPLTRERHRCITSHFNFVALDGTGKPAPVRPLVVESKEERRDFEVAEIVQNKAKMRRQKIAETEAGHEAD